MKPFPAKTIFADRYEILAAAGRGGMAAVYRARHLGLGKEVALKVLAESHNSELEARFSREARAIAKLDHPGCVRVLDYGRADGMQFLVMELLEGPTLKTVMKERVTMHQALSIARQLLLALAHAHSHGIIHRDIKPDNVMMVRDRTRAVLIDFGLASLHNEAPLTAAGMCLGSPSYLAPERLRGEPHDVRTDLYAVGVILYEMVAGVKPFDADTPQETMRLALHRPPRPLRAVRRDIPPALDKLIRRALAKDPEKRFFDAEEMLLALGDVPDDQPAAEDELGASMTVAMLDLHEPSWLSRLWSRLRYGAWRWRHSDSG